MYTLSSCPFSDIAEYNYDALGHLINFTERAGDDRILQVGHSSYDEAGRLSQFTYQLPNFGSAKRQYTYIIAWTFSCKIRGKKL